MGAFELYFEPIGPFGLSNLAWGFILLMIASTFIIAQLWWGIRKAKNPALQKAQDKHLKHIEELIINWTNCLEIQPIHLVAKGMPIPTDVVTNDPFFNLLKKHLPYRKHRKLWNNFSNWEMKVNEYSKACKKLKSQIQKYWKIEGTVPTEYFAEPILKLIDGDKKELPYCSIHIIKDHKVEEVKYQALVADRTEVVSGLETLKGGNYQLVLSDEQCSSQLLTLEYKRIAEEFKDNDTTIKARELFKYLRELQDDLKEILQETLERGDYITKKCELCPIK